MKLLSIESYYLIFMLIVYMFSFFMIIIDNPIVYMISGYCMWYFSNTFYKNFPLPLLLDEIPSF